MRHDWDRVLLRGRQAQIPRLVHHRKDLITVRSAYGTQSTQLGGHRHTPEVLARLILHDLVGRSRRKK